MGGGYRRVWMLVAGGLALAAAAACNRNGATAPSQGAPATGAGVQAGSAGGQGGYASAGSSYGEGGRYGGGRFRRRQGEGGGAEQQDVPLFHGEPMWSQNRTHTAQENAEFHFEQAGAEIGARTLDEFLAKTHRFVDHPPAGTLTVTRRNGDRLLYDPRNNIFAVATAEGAPRTIFKPANGMEYWTEQKQQAEQGGQGGGYGQRRRRNGYGGGYGQGGYGQGGYGGGRRQGGGGGGYGGDGDDSDAH